jgi:cation-transporting ATPase E
MKSTGLRGLNPAEVNERISRGQYNKTAAAKTKTISRIFIENIFSVFNFIIGFIIIFLFFFYMKSYDERLILDSFGVFSVAFINTMIAIYQEIKAKRALDKVNLLLKKEVSVLRDGKLSSIRHNEIVMDDVIHLNRGDQAVVDGVVLNSNHMEINESLLTGESLPVEKNQNDTILSGTFCVSGNGYYRVNKIGQDSYAAHITQLARKFKFSVSPLQRKINLLVKALFVAAVVLVMFVVLPNLNRNFETDFVRKIATILVALVPQGLVLMASVTFSIGIYRISKIGAIVQKLNAIESFSNVQVICMDKTGTLTQNKLGVYCLTPLTGDENEEKIKRYLGTYSRFSSDKNATIRALEVYEPEQGIEAMDEIPFNSERKMSFLRVKKGSSINTYALGAYDLLIEKTDKGHRSAAQKYFDENQLEVYRNLLFAELIGNISLDDIRKSNAPFKIKPICIVSITDKIREDVFEVIHLFKEKGIKFKILSGDSFPAIQAVCREIGWEITGKDAITGDDLEALDKNRFDEAAINKLIFARLKPEQKLQIIKVLRTHKIYTTMIGDGVNDLPAIKEADLGIAMEEGSSVTKEIADIVLLKNKFTLLPQIFNEGNKIVNTVGSIARLFLTKNFMVIYLSLLSIFFLLEFPLTPRRVSLINIFAIGLPAMIIALRNQNTDKYRKFIPDLLTFVSISAFFIVFSGYIGLYISKNSPNSGKNAQMVMLSVMIVTAIANFLAVIVDKFNKYNAKYILYAGAMLWSYFYIVSTTRENTFINFCKQFYEIEKIQGTAWELIISVSLVSSILLILIQDVRKSISISKSMPKG